MISAPLGVRVYLACGTTDMRNYVECLVMRSADPGCSSETVHRAIRSA